MLWLNLWLIIKCKNNRHIDSSDIKDTLLSPIGGTWWDASLQLCDHINVSQCSIKIPVHCITFHNHVHLKPHIYTHLFIYMYKCTYFYIYIYLPMLTTLHVLNIHTPTHTHTFTHPHSYMHTSSHTPTCMCECVCVWSHSPFSHLKSQLVWLICYTNTPAQPSPAYDILIHIYYSMLLNPYRSMYIAPKKV